MSHFTSHNQSLTTKSIVINDILFKRSGNTVTMTSQGNWTLNGEVTIPEDFRPSDKTLIIVIDTVKNQIGVDFLNKNATKYTTNGYVYIFGVWTI